MGTTAQTPAPARRASGEAVAAIIEVMAVS
jgi:hypothetical protein